MATIDIPGDIPVDIPGDIAEIDPLDPHLFVRGAAHPYFTWLREHDPVHWDERNRLWVVTKYDDVVSVERAPDPYSSAQGIRPHGGGADSLSIIALDDPEHARQRRLISKAFTPARINELMGRIREVARQLVDEIAPLGECDFVERIAYPLPLIVIAEMIGLPVADREQLARWSDAMMGGDCAAEGSPEATAAAQAWGEYVTYLVDLLEDHRTTPRDDLISVLLEARDAGAISGHDAAEIQRLVEAGARGRDDELRDDELLTFLVLLLVAGNETTRNALSGGMAVLSEHPDQLADLAADPSLVPGATEEILRWVSPVLNFTRTLTAAAELRGVQLRAGDRVLLVYPSANRDADQFPEPFRFDIRRAPNQHLAFGTGPHFCLGANLARTEIRILLEELLARLPDVRVAAGAGPQRGPSTLVGTIESLPITFTPA
jgi:cytochrome P450 family 142 subfamily A polypeptide 1